MSEPALGTTTRPAVASRAPADRPTLSFELFPPRDVDNAPRTWETVRALEATHPDFVSVTYGASGRTRTTSRALVSRILRETTLTPIAHLTCVGTSREEVATIVGEFLEEGVRSFLALRGDPPAEGEQWRAHPDGLTTAAGLVGLLRQIEEDGLIEREAGRVTIVDERALARAANYVNRYEGLDLSWLPLPRS